MTIELDWYKPDQESVYRATQFIDSGFLYIKELSLIEKKGSIDKITALVELLEHHHLNTLSHTFEDVFLATTLIVDYVGKAKGALPFIEEVFLGALLHDIGKTAVPQKILNSDKTNLPPEEKQILDLHSQFGSEILKRVGIGRRGYFCDEHHVGNSNSIEFSEKDINNRHPLTEFVSMADTLSGMMDPRRQYHDGRPKTAEEVTKAIHLKHKNGKLSNEIMDSFERVFADKNMFPPFFSTEKFGRNSIFMELIDKYRLGDILRSSMQKRKN